MKVIGMIWVWILTVGTVIAQDKIGVINVELIMSYMPEVQTADQQLQTYTQQLEKQLAVKQEIFQQEVSAYQLKLESGAFEGKMMEHQAIADKLMKQEKELNKEVEDAEYKLSVKRTELLQPVQIKLQKAIDEVKAEKGLTYVLNQTIGDGIPSILYIKPEANLTKDVARKLGIQVEE